AMLKRAQEDFSAAFPEIGRPEIKSAWAGMIDTTPDVLPVLDRVASLPGLVIATGMCGHGFGIGPGIGRVVADLVVGGEVEHDLSRFRLSRFSDGSKLVPGLTI
ncbi:MAG: FAD-binding oxidoreductase, partial [bacterium]